VAAQVISRHWRDATGPRQSASLGADALGTTRRLDSQRDSISFRLLRGKLGSVL